MLTWSFCRNFLTDLPSIFGFSVFQQRRQPQYVVHFRHLRWMLLRGRQERETGESDDVSANGVWNDLGAHQEFSCRTHRWLVPVLRSHSEKGNISSTRFFHCNSLGCTCPFQWVYTRFDLEGSWGTNVARFPSLLAPEQLSVFFSIHFLLVDRPNELPHTWPSKVTHTHRKEKNCWPLSGSQQRKTYGIFFSN